MPAISWISGANHSDSSTISSRFFLILSFFAKRLFWVSQKLKLGARRSEKPLFFIDFFLYFHFSFLWELALWSPSWGKNPLFPLSPGISIFILFLINRGITEWEWGERSFFFVFFGWIIILKVPSPTTSSKIRINQWKRTHTQSIVNRTHFLNSTHHVLHYICNFIFINWLT